MNFNFQFNFKLVHIFNGSYLNVFNGWDPSYLCCRAESATKVLYFEKKKIVWLVFRLSCCFFFFAKINLKKIIGIPNSNRLCLKRAFSKGLR